METFEPKYPPYSGELPEGFKYSTLFSHPNSKYPAIICEEVDLSKYRPENAVACDPAFETHGLRRC
jgi:hypothetical protein